MPFISNRKKNCRGKSSPISSASLTVPSLPSHYFRMFVVLRDISHFIFFVVYVVDGEDEEMCTCATRKQITDGSMVPDKCCGVSTMPECAIRNGKMNYYYYTYGYSRLNEMLSKCWKAEFFQLWWMLSLMSFALFMRAVDIIMLQYSPKFQCCGQFVVRAQWFSLKMVHNGCASHIMRFEFHIAAAKHHGKQLVVSRISCDLRFPCGQESKKNE